MNAYDELMNELKPDEQVEAIVFGEWGWSGYCCPGEKRIPLNLRGKVLTIEKAKPLMQSWSFYSNSTTPDSYATYIWTNKRVLWVTQYDGSTNLDSAPRNPMDVMPDMPGG